MTSKEAFEKWVKTNSYRLSCADCEESAKAAWQAAIQSIKDGGPSAYQHPDGDCGTSPHHLCVVRADF